jgi:hypothetical protein
MSARIPAITEAAALAHFDATASVSLTNGTFLVEDGAAYDQAHMRAGQLAGLLMLMRVDDASGYRMLGDDMQRNLMWLASQMADEVQAVLPLAAKEQRQEKRAAGSAQ